ncbi:MAG: hypothetical protein ACE5QW_08365, partial [Thermoplasmata archaeon]
MKKSSLICRRAFSIFFVLTFVFLPFLGSATADGVIFGKRDAVFYLDQDSQYAVIHYANGIQRMLLSVSFPWQQSSNTAWIFPLPSDPQSIRVRIVDGAPEFGGTNIIEEAMEDVENALPVFAVSYPLSAVIPWPLTLITYYGTTGLIGGTTAGTTVHKHLEMYGLVVEVISATEGVSIYNYLTDKGLEISEGIIPQLDDYVEANYSFVVTWIKESGTTLREPGVIVEFPTEEIFYPWMLTSIYGNDIIPMEILIVGHVSPRIYDEIRPYVDVTYWRGWVSHVEQDMSFVLQDFVRSIRHRWDGSFTAIELSAPSSTFVDDLWIKMEVPEKVIRAEVIHRLIGGPGLILTFLILFVIASPLIGL